MAPLLRHCLAALVLLCGAVLCGALAPAARVAAQDTASAARLWPVDAPAIDVPSLTIENGRLHGAAVPPGLTLEDLQRIERPETKPSEPPPSAQRIEFHGGQLYAESLSIADEKCSLRWLGQSVELPIDVVRVIDLQKIDAPGLQEALAKPSPEHDRLLVRDAAGALTTIRGLLSSLSNEQIKLEVSGQSRTLATSDVLAVILAQPAAAASPDLIRVHFTDGSHLSGSSLTLRDSQATLKTAAAGSIPFAWPQVAFLTIRSPRVAYLSELKPLVEKHRPLVTPDYPARRDQSALGRPLALGGTVYERGLGVHAYSELTFPAEGRWDTLAATIGLDPSAGRQGDCRFKILADGSELFSQRLRGSDPPKEINIPISGKQRITLVVEPGDDLDLGDHANWCDARLIKNKQ